MPVKFQLKRADGTVVQATSLPVWLDRRQGRSHDSSGRRGSCTPIRLTVRQHVQVRTASSTIYNWKTDKNQANFYWRIGVQLDDGQIYSINIGLR